jgi:hypothetical protein
MDRVWVKASTPTGVDEPPARGEERGEGDQEDDVVADCKIISRFLRGYFAK